jgi:ketosteroid isomerase-like protein
MSRYSERPYRSRLAARGGAEVEALFSILDENVEWDYVGAFPEQVTYHGPAQVREFLGQWAAGFDDFGFEAEEAIDAGDSVVVQLHQWGARKGNRRAGREPHLAGVHLPGR